MTAQAILWTALPGFLAAAVWFDLRQRRIPNLLVLAMLASGLLLSIAFPNGAGTFSAGWATGLRTALLGACAGLALTLPLYAFHAMGAGDSKLIAAIGAWVGPIQLCGVLLLTAVAGGVLAVLQLTWPRLRAYWQGDVRLALLLALSGAGGAGAVKAQAVRGQKMPYALAIGIGTVAQLALAGRGHWIFR